MNFCVPCCKLSFGFYCCGDPQGASTLTPIESVGARWPGAHRAQAKGMGRARCELNVQQLRYKCE